MQPCDSEHGVVDAVAFEAAVAEALPGLYSGEDVLDAGADLFVGLDVGLLPVRQFLACAARRWGITSPVPGEPPSAMVIVWPIAAFAPDSFHAVQSLRLPGKAHKPSTLVIAGRRVLVSRKWSGKSLADHRHDGREFVHSMLAHLGITKTTEDHEPGRYQWRNLDPSSPHMPPRDVLLLHAVSEQQRWRAEYEHAKATANGTNSPPGPETSATPQVA